MSSGFEMADDSGTAPLEIPFTRFIGADGVPVAEVPDFALDVSEMVKLYRAMVLTRTFDERAVALQRTGQLGTFASSLGQEATSVGAAGAMRREDVLVPSFREQGAQLWRGVSLKELFLYWSGDERGSNFAVPREDFPVSIPVASHVPHAAGVALAFKLRSPVGGSRPARRARGRSQGRSARRPRVGSGPPRSGSARDRSGPD